MANTFDLVGSPLGLFTLKSRPTIDGMSSFNGGESRNVNVIAYNTGKKQPTNLKGKDGNIIDSPVSLFSGGTLPNFWANIKTSGTNLDPTGTSREYDGFSREDLHNNDVYDTSLLNIIEKLSKSKMAALRPQDFAYLKNVGVFPNNRLMIARRFLAPVKDNIMGSDVGGSPKSILISWNPEGENFLDISFGEIWDDAKADFTDVLNSIGEQISSKGSGTKGLGSGLGKGIGLTPLPGFTEQLQRDFLASIGILDKDGDDAVLPSGNPNLIKKAKQRRTLGYGREGSGLNCTVSIKMKVEYEQKFISGIDPTIAWMDIISNILVFGTSKSTNYGLSDKFRGKIDTWTSNPSILISDIATGLKSALNSIIELVNKSVGNLSDESNSDQNTTNDGNTEKTIKDKLSDALEASKNFASSLLDVAFDAFIKTIKKYKVELMGIANALSGAPSTPWHITIGNPLRPIFCSGDMYMSENVKLTLGPTLAFNDLPSNITVDFTLTNARPWGLQEIMAKFNTGHLRTVNIQKDFLEVDGKPGGFYFENLDKTNQPETPPQGVSTTGTSDVVLGNRLPPTLQTKENAE